MKAKLIAITEPIQELKDKGITNTEEYIAHVARVSNPDNRYNNETSGKLLKFLIKNKHWSPFEMAMAAIEINTTRDIGRQILRHRSFSFQEFSLRYSPTSDGFEYREARLQDQKNRQNSIKTNDAFLQGAFDQWQDMVHSTAMYAYKESLKHGVAKEQARALLPEGLTDTTIIMNGTIRSWIHYCAERTKEGVQLEHRLIAKDIQDILGQYIPSIADIIKDQT